MTIEGETLVTTADHPFYTVAGEWVEAGDLRLGDDIRMASWATGNVESVYIVTQPQPMYNFTVATAHTYFVGEYQWLVHNTNCWPLPSGVSNNREFGEFIGWGTDGIGGKSGGQWALERMDNLIIDDIYAFIDGGLTSDMAQQWADTYLDVYLKNNNNPSAWERAQLMQYIADWLREIGG